MLAVFLHSWVRLHNDNTRKIDHGSRVGFFFFIANKNDVLAGYSPTTVAAALVTPVIGKASRPLALPEFSLISFDKSGYRQPLPPGLGDLPLYLDDDGYFSVNGSMDFRLVSPHTALTPVSHDNESTFCPLTTDIPGFSGENPDITPDPHVGHLNADTISKLVTSLPSSLLITHLVLMVLQ